MTLRSFVVAAAMLAGAALPAEAATWTIDAAKSHLGFTGSENGSAFTGHFGTFSGTIVFDPATPASGHADVTIATGSAATGDQQKDGALPDSDWFAANKFPQAHFVATAFKATGPSAYDAVGTLTIRGVTKPVTLPFTLAITGNTAKADGTVQLIRTDYGVGQGAWSTAQYVALQVSVSFDIIAEKTAPMNALPTYFAPHGGGPCFFMDPPMGPPGTWDRMAAFLRSLAADVGATPRAILAITGHWETDDLRVTAGANPPLIYDYYGFPESTYQLTYPAPGSPALAAEVAALLRTAGFPTTEDPERGFDHGVFIPFKVAFPEADIPVVELSVRKDLDPAAHIAIGRALAPLREDGVLILATGMSYHNLRGFFSPDPRATAASDAFDGWLTAAVCETDPAERDRRLIAWETAPAARRCHPQEEHLLPLMVAAGAAGADVGRHVYADRVFGKALSGFRFG